MSKFNFFGGIAASSWLLALLVIGAELFPPLKEALASAFSHHWIGKGAIIAIAFLLFGFLLKNKAVSERIGINSARASLLIIFLFYVIEFFV